MDTKNYKPTVKKDMKNILTTKEQIENIMYYLLHNNKNYTKKQYYMLLELEDILKDVSKWMI